MSGTAAAPFDWPGWRADVVERLDRRSIGIMAAWVSLSMALQFVGARDARGLAVHALFIVSMVLLTLVILAVALVAITRRIPVWVAWPAAALATAVIVSVLGVAIDPYHFRALTPTPPMQAVIVRYLYFLSLLGPFAVLYAYASSATHDDKVLRLVEAERAAEAERLAQQRLKIELATVDHDLILRAMRLALNAPAHGGAQAEPLLQAVTSYLRAAQQRDSSEPGRVAAALAELRQACARQGAQPTQPAAT
jgi:hypothetical protein